MRTHLVSHIAAQLVHQVAWTLLAMSLLGVLGIVVTARAARIVAARRSIVQSQTQDIILLATILTLSATDWVLLWALPRLRLSFPESIAVPGLVTLLIRLLSLWALLAARLLGYWRRRSREQTGQAKRTLALGLALNVILTAAQIDAYVIEPLLTEMTELSLTFEDLDAAAPPIRVVHITDTHIERNSYREADLVRRVNALEPDIIVLSGDYLNLSRVADPTSAEHWRQLVAQLDAPYGIYATRGSVEQTQGYMRSLIEGTTVTWLEQETAQLNVRGQEVTLVGVACSHDLELDRVRLREALADIPPGAFTLLLYHSPDLIAEAAEAQIDLYLGGHTHGGQLRLPLIGPIVTGSVYGRQYVNGLFERDQTRMYISRGLGFEGSVMPRARFLCRPEFVSLELGGS